MIRHLHKKNTPDTLACSKGRRIYHQTAVSLSEIAKPCQVHVETSFQTLIARIHGSDWGRRAKSVAQTYSPEVGGPNCTPDFVREMLMALAWSPDATMWYSNKYSERESESNNSNNNFFFHQTQNAKLRTSVTCCAIATSRRLKILGALPTVWQAHIFALSSEPIANELGHLQLTMSPSWPKEDWNPFALWKPLWALSV